MGWTCNFLPVGEEVSGPFRGRGKIVALATILRELVAKATIFSAEFACRKNKAGICGAEIVGLAFITREKPIRCNYNAAQQHKIERCKGPSRAALFGRASEGIK